MSYLLSICIPTFNRCEYLSESLNQLLPQIEPFKDVIEILVSDNCSDDKTEEVVNCFIEKKSLNIIFNRNDRNIGADNNIDKIIKRASGKYIYIMGDDDIVAPDFISVVINLLISHVEISLLHFNRLVGDAKCSNNIIKDSMYEILITESSFKEFVYKIVDKANFISSIVFNSKCWNLGSPFAKECYDGYIWYGRLLNGARIHNHTCIYYYMPLLIQRNPSKSWIKFWPQYRISSMSSIFYDLDPYIPGIYNIWMKKLHGAIHDVLPCVIDYKDYYRKSEVKELLGKHLNSTEKIKMKVYLYAPGAKYILSAKNKLVGSLIKLLLNWK